jgi:hypothetical protein
VDRGFRRTFDAAEAEFVGLPRLIEALSATPVFNRIVGLKDKHRPHQLETAEQGRS